jgi:hypothetical protein
MLSDLQKTEMQVRFGDRFESMRLAHVELLHWPVWCHEFSYTVFDAVSLDPLEEGVLLLIAAGVGGVPDLAALLGCSERYVREMVDRLGGQHSHACLEVFDDGRVAPTPQTAPVLEARIRQVPLAKSTSLFRDGVFGSWLSYGETSFTIDTFPSLDDDAARWLEASVDHVFEDDGAKAYALTLVPDPEVIASTLSSDGSPAWATLWLACYQPNKGSGGRYLLFNPACEDTPLQELSLAFEQELLGDRLKLYFPDDRVSTSSLFWQGLASRLTAERKTEELQVGKEILADAEVQLAAALTIVAHDSPESSISLESQELAHLRQVKNEMENTVKVLAAELAAIPRTEHIEAHQHPAILLKAINDANAVLVLICPWVKMRVLRSLLPAIDEALLRGCEVFIGYGMPKNPNHPENSDEDALTELRKRQQSGLLRLSHLSTHEKVIVQDDRVFVNSSFNFLSYTGGDHRRESGTIWRGGVGPIRDKFVAAFPRHTIRTEAGKPTTKTYSHGRDA